MAGFGFGAASSGGLFGAGSGGGLFGAASSGGSGGGLFGAGSGAPVFGAASSGGSGSGLFGAGSGAPAFGAASSGGSGGGLFGAAGSGSGGGLFGAGTGAATFGAASSGGAGGGLFGAASSGGPGGGLFGAGAGGAAFGAGSSGGSGGSLFGASSSGGSGGGVFGAGSGAPGFGAASSGGSGGGLFGAASSSGSSGSMFGAASSGGSGGGLFGAASSGSAGGFGQPGALGASGGAAVGKRAFRLDEFEDFHGRFIAPLVAGSRADNPELEAQFFAELQDRKETLATLRFRGREDGLDLQNLARGIQLRHPRLFREDLVRLVDEVSRIHRLSQEDCCTLVEQALPLPVNPDEWLRVCAGMYYRECHFLALCLHDMAQNLVQSPPDPCSIVFFATLQEAARSLAPADQQQTSLPFVKAIFDALVLLLSDLTGERSGDQMFLTHAGTMIQLLVETLLAFFFAFSATAHEAERIVCLLPHVVVATAAPLSQGYTVSDLDLLLREEHADISIKLCLALVCICHPHIGDSKLDITKVPQGATPATLRMVDLAAEDRYLNIFGPAEPGKTMKEKMDAGTYWNEESQLGQFLCFAISGLLLDDEGALRKGYVHWHIPHFFLHEILLSSNLIGDSLTSRLVLRCVHWLLAKALLPVGRKWIAVKKLEAQAVNYRFLGPDALQIAVLRTVNRLARVYPPACDTFRDIAVNCADTFHLTLPHGGPHFDSAGGADPWADPRMHPSHFSLGGGAGGPQSIGAPTANLAMQPFGGDAAPWIGAPRSRSEMHATSSQIMPVARHDNSALYAEILDFIASLCARGSLQVARFLSQKLHAHNNQWFNWAFILDSVVQLLRDPLQLQQQQQPQQFWAHPSDPAASSALQRHFSPPIVATACHLISAMCSSRLLVSHPSPLLDTQSMQTVFYAGSPSAENFAALLTEVLGAHPDLMVKAACLGALSHLSYTPAAARQTFTVVTDLLPSMLAGICDIRGSCDGLLAIELLACALRLAQAVPLSKGRYSLNLQPLTHVVIHFIYMKVLSETSQFANVPRYWRLANLSLRWLRLALRGPLPFSTSPYVNQALIEPYADGEPSLAPEVANRSAMGNAASYVFRALLALDSPIFRRVMYLTLLRGHGVDGLVLGRRSSALRPLMEQTVRVGLDVIRILLQRDVLFCRLHAQQAAQRVEGSGAQLDESSLLLTHNLLFAEFAFQYPPEYTDAAKTAASAMLNPFAARRVWQTGSAAMPLALAGASGQRLNPSNFNLLLEYVGAQHSPQIASLALFIFTQCSLRDPSTVLRGLQLEPWRLQRISADLYHQILSPEEETEAAAMKEVYTGWDARAEARFAFEAAEMDALGDTPFHLSVSSFQTGMPVCQAVDVAQQMADDAIVQSADLAVWARGLELKATSSDAAYFRSAYLRGFEVQYDWIGAAAANYAIGFAGTAPPPALAVISCRLLSLRALVLLLGEVSTSAATSDIAPTLAQVLLGLEYESIRIGGPVDVDFKRRNQPLPLTAIMELLQNPPPLPSFPDCDAARPSGSGVLRAPRLNSSLDQSVKQHATYEAALAILVGLFDIPALRDVAFRFMHVLWGSRYQVLVNTLSQPWPVMPGPMRRVLMSEATLLMQALSWEMRLVQPWGTPNETEDSSIAGRDRQNMKYKAAETLQKVVRDILSTGEGEADGAVHGTTPFLVATVQKLAEACDVLADASPQLHANVLFSRDPIHDALQASTCACLAPSESGQMKFCLELRDPHVFLRVWDREQKMLPAAAVAEFTAAVAWQTRSAFASQDVPAPPDRYDDECKNALRDLGMSNELVCTFFYANAIFDALGVFMSALLYHLTSSIRLTAIARDPRAQDVRAHLEALLPELAESMLANPSLHRFKTFTGFATKLISAMQRVETPAPLTFAYSLFRLLRGVAVHPKATAAMRLEAHHALLLLLERMLPDIHDDVGDASLATIGPDDLAELRRLVFTLLSSAFSPVSTTTVASQHDYYTTPLQHSVCNAVSTSIRRSPPAPDMTLALLGALLARVPPQQLPEVFPSAELWQQLTGLLNAAHVDNPVEQLQLRCSAMCVAALLCRTPPLASGLYESGGLAAVMRPELLNAAQVHFAPAGLPALDMPHPAVLLVILQALSAAVGALPTHILVVSSVLTWLESHHQKLLEFLQWVARLPLATMPEPRQRVTGGTGDDLGGALHSAQIVNAVTAMSAGAIQGGALLLVCSATSQPDNSTSELVAETLSGRCWFSSLGSNPSVEERDRVLAFCHRCAHSFVELWASLCTAAHRCGTAPSQHFSGPKHPEAVMSRLAPVIDPALSTLLALYSSLERPTFRDVDMQDNLGSQHHDDLWQRNRRVAALNGQGQPAARPGVQGGTMAVDAKSVLEQGLYPSEPLQIQVCMHILEAWRYDPVTQQLQVLTDQRSVRLGQSQPPHLAPFFAANPDVIPQLLTRARARANLLSLMFVHACSNFLSLRLVKRQHVVAGERRSGDSPHLQFEGSREQFRHLLFIVEVTLHLLQSNLSALLLAGLNAAPTPGAPRLASVLQHLRVLKQFAAAVGGTVALAARLPQSVVHSSESLLPPARMVDLTYAARSAQHVEQQLLELQNL